MDPLVIQAMKNNNLKPIRVFNKQADVDRIYGHRPYQRFGMNNDIEDEKIEESCNFSRQGNIDVDLSNINDQETAEMQRKIRQNRAEKSKEKIKEEEKKLKLAQKLHQVALEEMEAERRNLEKLLEEKKKLLQENSLHQPSLPVPPAPPSPVKEIALEQNRDKEMEENICCVVCMDAKRCVLCDPCLHVALCLDCSKNLNQCPMCMAPATMKRIFLA